MLIDELHSYIFDGKSHILAEPMSTWLASSRPFSVFVNTFRDKIRKKVRTTQDRENLVDLRLELETAYLLLREKLLSVAYEPHQSEKTRGPDFAVTFTTSLTFMVEVTRIRGESKEQTQVTAEQLIDAICNKLGQLKPQHSNILIVGVEALHLTSNDLRAVMLRLQQRAESNDATLLQRYRFQDRASFFQQYYRLSEILLRDSDSTIAWVNPQAKYPLPGKVRTVLYRSHTV